MLKEVEFANVFTATLPTDITEELTKALTEELPTLILVIKDAVFETNTFEVNVPVIAALPTAVFESTVTAYLVNAKASSFVLLRQ